MYTCTCIHTYSCVYIHYTCLHGCDALIYCIPRWCVTIAYFAVTSVNTTCARGRVVNASACHREQSELLETEGMPEHRHQKPKRRQKQRHSSQQPQQLDPPATPHHGTGVGIRLFTKPKTGGAVEASSSSLALATRHVTPLPLCLSLA